MKEKILSNIWLKIFSVVLALSLWIFVSHGGQSEMTVEAPVEIKNVPKGLEILKQNIKSASLNIRGHETVLKGLKPMDVRVVIDLANARKGEATYYFEKGKIIIPKNLKVLRIDPTHMRVTLDETISKTVLVKASIIGSPERGYRIKSINVSPSYIAVEGSKTEVNRIGILRIEPIDITGIDTDMVQNARISTAGKNIRTDISEVTVKIKVARD